MEYIAVISVSVPVLVNEENLTQNHSYLATVVVVDSVELCITRVICYSAYTDVKTAFDLLSL